jgi:hypothetical protein
MKYFENFLSDYCADIIEETLMHQTFPWYYLNEASVKNKPKEYQLLNKKDFGFYHSIFSEGEGGITSNYYQIFLPMIHLLKKEVESEIQIQRIRLGMSTTIGENMQRHPHVDFAFPHKTFLYYVNDSDGDTVFYKSPPLNKPSLFVEEYRNTPKKNTAILFDGLQYHSSSFPVKNDVRLTVNINFTESNNFYNINTLKI